MNIYNAAMMLELSGTIAAKVVKGAHRIKKFFRRRSGVKILR